MTIISKRKFLISAGLAVFFSLSFSALGADINQQILDLRAQVEALTKQAELYKKNITAKRKEADTLSRQIDILNNQILKLETQISITEKNISTSKIEIAELERKIFEAQEEIIKEKTAIGKLIAMMYERDRTSLTAILIKNPTISAYTDIVQQDKSLNSSLNNALAIVKEEKEQLQNSKSILEEKKKELEILNTQQVEQRDVVSETKQNKNQLLVKTKGKEKEYQALLAEVEKKETAFFNELKKLEAEAIKAGAFIIHVTAPKVPAKGTWSIRWPEDDYYITQGYGMTAYARRGTYGGSPHNGVDMASGLGTPVHAIDNGKILASGISDGWGNWVAILHDNGMVSLYGHFKAPSGLANGTIVGPNSIIGYEGSTGNSTGSHLHLSIYRDFFTYLNAKHKNQVYFNYFDGTVNPFDYLP